MFRPVTMMWLSAVVLGRDEKAALRRLGELGAVQLSRTAAGDDTAPVQPPDRSRELALYDRVLARIVEIRRALQIGLGPRVSVAAMTIKEAEQKLRIWEERVGLWQQRRDQLQRQAQEWQARCEQVRPYRTLDLPFQSLDSSSLLHYITGTLPTGELERVMRARDTLVLPLPPHQGRQPVLALAMAQRLTEIEESLQPADFRRDTLPVLEGASPAAVFARSQSESSQLTQQLQEVEEEGRALSAAAAAPLAEIQEWARVERRLAEAEQFFRGTEASVLMTGWIPANEVARLEEELLRCTGGRCALEVRDVNNVPEEDVPVLLRHSRLLRPFEMLVTAYGLPRYGEMAPTLFVAMSYVLMFGMMFGDVGHGSLVALAGAILLWVSRARSRQDAGILLLINGLASAAFGLVYGSYFGLPQLKKLALWHDPLEVDPMALMLLALAIGVVLMSTGLGLNIVNRLRRGEKVEGCLDKFGIAGVVFYWGALALVTQSSAIRAQGWWTAAVLLFLVLPVGCWAVKEPLSLWRAPRTGEPAESSSAAAALAESLVSAFEGVLLYLANTISFVRLAAYAMSHAALLMATFTLADQVRPTSSAGPALALIIVILGNAIALVLEGIVAAVQALRLEYYEFFGKFFSGDGQPFKPFHI